MLKDIRITAGLGYPPSKFTTNASESLNAVMKRKVDYKETQWPLFNDNMKQLVLEQRDDVVRCLSGRGQYRLMKSYAHLQVLPQEWARMNSDQRKKLIKQFDCAAQLASHPCSQQGLLTSDSPSTTVSSSVLSQPSCSYTPPTVSRNECFMQRKWH